MKSLQRFFPVLLVGIFLCDALGNRTLSPEENQQKIKQAKFAKEELAFFNKKVLPILRNNCFKCHGGEKKIKSGLRLTSREGILKGGDQGPAVELKKPSESLILDAISYEDEFFRMPPMRKLKKTEIAVLRKWIEKGLPWPEGKDFGLTGNFTKKKMSPQITAETKNHWSFKKVVRPKVPPVQNRSWVKNPVDAFILARLEQAKLQPSSPAKKTALLRRVYYDLIGLPPSPEEVNAFLIDRSAHAYETVVDRLLNSPHFGEKSARGWLDVVRYAESNSFERDGTKPFVWRYRDYVIRAFNSDKPYDRFLEEQLAGDELEKVTPETIIATGYYRLGQWDDEPADPQRALFDDLDDILTTTSQGMLGLTMNCCRCHDHKLDPIPQKDYYRFLGFFRNIKRYGVRSFPTVAAASLKTIASPEEQQKQQAEIAAHRAQQEKVKREFEDIESIVKPTFENVEHEEFKYERNRIAIVKKRVPGFLSHKQFDRYVALKKRFNELRRFRPKALEQALCVKEHGPNAPKTFVLIRGNAHAPGKEVTPGFPQILSPPKPKFQPPAKNAHTSNRRLALAQWITSKENPLTARVMMNRLWKRHFSRGIVRSPNNFGLQGIPPTHPQLLDWLAAEFMQGGWKLKRMHKIIVMSNAYRMSSQSHSQGVKKDQENNLFWRFNPRRLSAEEIRDSILAVNGSLNLKKMYGPSIYPVIPKEVLAGQSRPGAGWGKSSEEDLNRRSIYIHIKRSLIVPLMAAFDVADTDFTCPVRFATTQPTQSLALMNGDYANRQAEIFAQNLIKSCQNDLQAQVAAALKRVLQRTPSQEEIQRGISFIDHLKQNHGKNEAEALKYFCLLTLNLNEFLFLD